MIDRSVDVIRVDTLTGETMATIISTAAHPIVLGPATCECKCTPLPFALLSEASYKRLHRLV